MTLGKVDERGNVAEDLRSQILGQLSEKLSYEKLYRDALDDPELRRTRLEVEAALANANEARKVVFELFQDLERFSLDDYKPFRNVDQEFDRIVQFLADSLAGTGQSIQNNGSRRYKLIQPDGSTAFEFTTDRQLSRAQENLPLLGLDHPFLKHEIEKWQSLPETERGAVVSGPETAVIALWHVETRDRGNQRRTLVLTTASSLDGHRLPAVEAKFPDLLEGEPVNSMLALSERSSVLHSILEPMLERELQQRGLLSTHTGYLSMLLAWVETHP
jgi:hypothetical protein